MDTLFLDGQRAVTAARQQNMVKLLNGHFSVKQICYHVDSIKLGVELETLFYIPVDQVYDFFYRTKWRFPRKIDFDSRSPEQVKIVNKVASQINACMRDIKAENNQMLVRIHEKNPVFISGKMLRVYLLTSIRTTVMQYASRDVAKAFERLGCEVYLDIEKDERESLNDNHILQSIYSFNPHIVININNPNHYFNLHPDVYNVVWYQDPTPDIRSGKPLPWRKRDLVFSAYPAFDELIRATGAPVVERQDMCVDLACFRNTTPRDARHKVVFIGSSYHHFLHAHPVEERIFHLLRDMFEQGEPIPDTLIQDLARQTGIPYIQINQYIFTCVVRNRSVEWLCELAPDLAWEVEVYGRFWDRIPLVAPYYRGELHHGEAVATVYNQARYALSPHQRLIKSQRLVEITACGAFPVVNDDRLYTEPPHWEDKILFYRTRDELWECLHREPQHDPGVIAESFSYDALARRVLDKVSADSGWMPPFQSETIGLDSERSSGLKGS
ncbi:MAG: hypothetical protein HQL63_14465 [Magnetococcales bacterium]|nr:hypothetical protein [Magnetococcales bacterium]